MRTTTSLTLLVLGLAAPIAEADTFDSGENSFEIEFVNIGNPGNPADTAGSPNPAGSVDHVYRMGKFEISRDMITKANHVGALDITLRSERPIGGFTPEQPATGISWFEAAKFVNWLNTSEGKEPAYKFDEQGDFQLWQPADPGYNPDNLYRNRMAYYFLPSTDEWYKAAYYNPIAEIYHKYPTESGRPPSIGRGTEPNTAVYGGPDFSAPADIMLAGGLSPYGTMAQGGNASEWLETASDTPASLREYRGGAWTNDFQSFRSTTPSFRVSPNDDFLAFRGFRVASIPEPCTLLLAGLVVAGLSLKLRRCRRIL